MTHEIDSILEEFVGLKGGRSPEQVALALILAEQRRIGPEVAGISTSVNALIVENAKFPDKVRSVVREEMKLCPAFQFFENHRHGDGIVETTQEVKIHKEMIDALREKNTRLEREIEALRRGKASVPPREDKAPWWSPLAVKIALAIAGALSAGGLGAWGVHCSVSKTAAETDTARGSQPPVASSARP